MIRSGLLFWAVTLVGSCLLYFRPKQIVAVALALLILSPFISSGDEGVDNDGPRSSDSITSGLMHRLENSDSFMQRATYILNNFYWGMTRHPLGEGLGNGQPGGAYAAGKDRRGGYESEWGRIAFEIGPLGLAAVLFIRFATFKQSWQQFARATNDQIRLVMATVLPYFGIMSLGWMAFNHTGNSFAWAAIALSLGVVRGSDFQVNASNEGVIPETAIQASGLQ
jgi:hypothetical protein